MKTINATTESSNGRELSFDHSNEKNYSTSTENFNLSSFEEEFIDEDASFAQVEKFIGFVI